jgi:hypothetical protein
MFKSVYINSTETSSLDAQLLNAAEDDNPQLHLVVNMMLTKDYLAQLEAFVTAQDSFPFKKISLRVDSAIIQDPLFIKILEKLNTSSLSGLQLIFAETEVNASAKDLEKILTEKIAPLVSYPVQIAQRNDDGVIASADKLKLAHFQETVIARVQEKNTQTVVKDSPPQKTKASTGARRLDPSHPLAKPIPLKGLIAKNKLHGKDKDKFIQLEVQHVAALEHEVSHEEVVELQVEVQLQEIQKYAGTLIGFAQFESTAYKARVKKLVGEEATKQLYKCMKKELFANLPQAIKYVSPEAAEQLVLDLPGLVSLNKENLPPGFLLKKTAQGEFVLDYDPYLENDKSNPFTPTAASLPDFLTPIYDIELGEDKVKSWVGNDYYFGLINLSEDPKYKLPDKLVNMWIKYGDTGVTDFFKKLWDAVGHNPDSISFLQEHYLRFLPQWDHLYKDEAFFSSLERISHYDKDKLTCLKKFLVNTGSSRHDLSNTVAAFEVFWSEVSHLCKEKNIPLDKINTSWTTGEGGQPVVYMERLLYILKNARDLKEQLTNLADLKLDNYGAYYAARYEGLKSVSVEMRFNYDADKQNKLPFTPDFQLYRVNLEQMAYTVLNKEAGWYRYVLKNQSEHWLIDSDKADLTKPLDVLKEEGLAKPFTEADFVPPYKCYRWQEEHIKLIVESKPPQTPIFSEDFPAYAFRFVGQQTTGILARRLIEEFQTFDERFIRYKPDYPKYLFAMLLLVTDERYVGDQYPGDPTLKKLFKHMEESRDHFDNALKELYKLYKLDIKLNDKEGYYLFYMISEMNSSEFQDYGGTKEKEEIIKKLFPVLARNKLAALKFLRIVDRGRPALYALDTAEYLAQDPLIDQIYHNDLLIFSYLINSKPDEFYYHNRKDDKTLQIKKNVEQLKHYLHKAAEQEKPNNLQYAIQRLLDGENSFSYKQFLESMEQIEKLPPAFDNKKVDEILKRHYKEIGAKLPEVFKSDNADLKSLMITLIMELDKLSQPKQDSAEEEDASKKYQQLPIAELQKVLNQKWSEKGTLLSIVGQLALSRILKTTKELSIQSAFKNPEANELLKLISEKISDLPDFQSHGDFEKVNNITSEAKKLADLFKQMVRNPIVIAHKKEFTDLFKTFDFSNIEYVTLKDVLSLLNNMPQSNYLTLATIMFSNPKFTSDKVKMTALLENLTLLHQRYFPPQYLVSFSQLVIDNSNVTVSILTSQLLNAYTSDNSDPVLGLAMTSFTKNYQLFQGIISLSAGIVNQRDKLAALFISLDKAKMLDTFLTTLSTCEPKSQTMILEIISKGQAVQRTNTQPVDYIKLIKALEGLSPEHLRRLHTFYQTTPVSINCLENALPKLNINTDFDTSLSNFEKAPFGTRDFAKQFDCSQVERVINNSRDLVNGSIYPYQYRKQLMEAFLFVNQIGNDLPVYNNKAAKDLSNAEIASFFTRLKNEKMDNLTPFQKRLLALGLMREAMYRSTGEYPYSTQMIALIDGMMHKGDLIANIDTGQGKSLVDSMKAVLLWLDSDRVDVSTSSLVDAKRDIANYGPFIKLLGIPFSEKPISSSSDIGEFQKNGINFSTFPQLSLFFARAKVAGTELEKPDTKVSLVLNESDYTLLDNRVIHRFASPDGTGIGLGQEWVYYAINEFVTRPGFLKQPGISAKQDIEDLKSFLISKARENNKSSKFVNKLNKFSDEQYLSWIESALIVNYQLKENEDFVIPEEFEKRTIGGVERRSKVAKVLLDDKKVSPDSVFGNEMQQLLYARLNKERGGDDFIIEPQNKTILSSNNKNLLEYYLAKEGFIWGSSGTVGSAPEIEEQYAKYGFDFAKKEPHQQNKVKFAPPHISPNRATQLADLAKKITTNRLTDKSAPNIVFCKDIPTAKAFFEYLQKQNPHNLPMQLYTGLGQEEDYIKRASTPGMITVTTSALGRNTDIHYDKSVGLNVWHTYVDSTRGAGQKDGRTGRQGSLGSVYHMLDAEELGGRTLEDITSQIDAVGAEQRRSSEELFDILGYLLTQIDKLPEANFSNEFSKGKPDFYKQHWSKFSTTIETNFREAKRGGSFDQQQFIDKTIDLFNQDIYAKIVPIPDKVTSAQFKGMKVQERMKAKLITLKDRVTLDMCTPPVTTAYKMLNFAADNEKCSTTVNQVKERLTQLFADIGKGSILATNAQYLRYLSASGATQELVVDAHKAFLHEFIATHSKKRNFILRWLGFEGTLNKMASNENYLLMFHALASVPVQPKVEIDALASVPDQPKVEIDLIRKSITALLDEYLENSWFLSTARRTEANLLKASIAGAEDFDSVVTLLTESQVNTLNQDLATNKKASGLQAIKPLNFLGESRFQTTLSRALNLTSALHATPEGEVKTTIGKLTSKVHELADTPEADITLDQVKNLKKKKSGTDKVIVSTIENALASKSRQEPVGMTGRKRQEVLKAAMKSLTPVDNNEKGEDLTPAPAQTK